MRVLKEVAIDDKCVIFENPIATDQGSGKYKIAGVVEPSALVIATALLTDGSSSGFLGTVTADANGNFVMDVNFQCKISYSSD